VAPDADDNPWHYKISWNPMNVVKAGQLWARFLADGKLKVVPYNQLFKRLELVEVPGYGNFEAYYNRDALPYEARYGLEGVSELVRGTLRKSGFCRAWDLLVETGLTSGIESFDLKGKTLAEFTEMFLPASRGKTIKERWCRLLGITPDDTAFGKLEWLGLLEDKPVPVDNGTPAEVLRALLVEKLAMKEADQDLIVMVHYFNYELQGMQMQRKSYLTLEGENGKKTAMAKTVGLPLGIATNLLMQGKLEFSGVHLPMHADIYEPVLEELKRYGILFRETDTALEE
jgi:saccharopine dehydrogenase (NADP+, L-glutamate forming)